MKRNLANLANFGGHLSEILANFGGIALCMASEFGLLWLILA